MLLSCERRLEDRNERSQRNTCRMFSQLLKSLSWLTATESATQIQVASATAAPSALVTVFVKELGGELQVFKDVSPNEYVGSFRRLLPSRELSPKSTLFHITDAALWARITADPAAETAFLSSSPKPEPVHGESPVLAGMRLLAVPPDVFKARYRGHAAGGVGTSAGGLAGLGALAAALPGVETAAGFDSSRQFVEELHKLAPAEIPALEALDAALQHPLPELLVHRGDFADFHFVSQLLDGALLRVRAVDAVGMYHRSLSRHLAYALFVMDFQDSEAWGATASEMDATVDIAAVVARLLRLLSKDDGSRLHLTTAHNSVDISDATVCEKGPDLLCWARHALVFKGEYRMSSTQWEEAKDDLVAKMTAGNVLALSGLPYLLCHAVAGTNLQFFALHERRAEDTVSLHLRPLTRVLKMDNLRDRGTAVVAVCNTFRLLCRLKDGVRRSAGLAFGVWHRRGRRKLLLEYHQVTKKCEPAAPKATAEELYGKLADGLPCCIRVVQQDWSASGRVRLVMTPVAMQTRPMTAAEHKAAMRCALTALAALHANGFVHRGVRPPNILFAGGNQWLLVDFEAADRAGSVMPAGLIDDAHLPPEVQAGNPRKRYTAAGDMYCLGKVMQVWSKPAWLDDAGRALLAALLDADPARRPSAAGALASPWFG